MIIKNIRNILLIFIFSLATSLSAVAQNNYLYGGPKIFYYDVTQDDLDSVATDYHLVNNDQETIAYRDCEKNPIGCGIMFRLEHLIKIAKL